MTQKELEKQAKEYGMTVEEIKEYRKHIKPFLRYAIKRFIGLKNNWSHLFMCHLIDEFTTNHKLTAYLHNRLWAAVPEDAKANKEYDDPWWCELDVNIQNMNKLNFLKQQLKIVKP